MKEKLLDQRHCKLKFQKMRDVRMDKDKREETDSHFEL